MDPDDRKRTVVGSIVLGMLVIAVGATVAFGNAQFSVSLYINVHFGHMASLEEGAEVHLAGAPIGQIVALRLVPQELVDEGHPLFPSGGVSAKLRIDERHADRAAVNGEYFVGSRGIFGNRYIEIGPPANGAPARRAIRDGDSIRGIDPPVLDRAVYNAMRNFEAYRSFVSELEPEIDALTTAIDQLDRHLEDIVPAPERWAQLVADSKATHREIGTLLEPAPRLNDIDKLMVSVRRQLNQAARRIDDASSELDALSSEIARVGRLDPGEFVEKFQRVQARIGVSIDRAQVTLALVKELAARFERAEGTVGALAHDPEFSDDARNLGKILKRQPWKVFGHPGNEKPRFGRPPRAPEF